MKNLILLFIIASTPLMSNAAKLNLGSTSENVSKKAKSIEQEYSSDMRSENSNSANTNNNVKAPANDAAAIEKGSDDEFAEFQEVPEQQSSPAKISNSNSMASSSSSSSSSFFGEPSEPGMSWISYPSTLKMRDQRKVGLGMSVGGSTGLVGLNVELNFEDADGAVAGFGTGPGYNSFQLAWKHAFEGDYLAPYAMGGYSRWYNSHGGDESTQSDILDRVLTAEEKKSGQFTTDFIFGAGGLQYNQLSGPLAGLSFYAEIVLMAEVKRSELVPTGGIGTTYFF
jgi:hypothetical protein